jgi:hypothetical protein
VKLALPVCKRIVGLLIAESAACLLICASARAHDTLVEGFRNPPPTAQPRLWWPWLKGNATEQGVRLDLEWMKRIGIGGLTHTDLAFEGWGAMFDTPQLIEKPLLYLSPQWQRALRDSAAAASESGLEFGIDSSAGWSESGGPWVTPQQAMKKLVWSETPVEGGRPFTGHLAPPPDTTGLFQNIPLVELGAAKAGRAELPTFYADVATLAYHVPAAELPGVSCGAQVTSSAGVIDAARLCDGDLATPVLLPLSSEEDAWIQFSFEQPLRIQAITAVIGSPLLGLNPLFEVREEAWLEASDDGRRFRKIVPLPQSGSPEQTVAFPPVVARVWRVILKRPEPSAFEKAGLAPAAVTHRIAELVLHTGARVNRFEDKAGYSTRQILDEDDTPTVMAADVIRTTDILDLTSRMRPDGTLNWTPPAGRWIVLRFGYSLIGRTNHPAERAGTGLEVDKLSRAHVKAYVDAYLSNYEAALGPDLMRGHALQYLTLDSYEVGAQNWTEDMFKEFRQRRGYELLSWLPVLTGRLVGSATASDRFLWDFRKTLAELIAAAGYGQLSASLHERGLGLYAESHEAGRAFIGDGMEAKKTADIPMGAMWAARRPVNPPENYDADIRESASVAHLYGKTFVAGESFTSAGNAYFAPQDLKPIADRELAMGANRFVISGSVHQPDSRLGPGLSVGPYGIRLTRKETWAERAGPWITYLARSAYLLQQGQFVADIAYLYGDDTNITSLFHSSSPAIPEGYNYDFVNPDALNELSVSDGRLVTRSGMKYRVLMLDASTRRLSLSVLRKLRDLVHAGAIVVGARPAGTPSLADDENEFRDLVTQVWDSTSGEHAVGEGRGTADRPLASVLAAMNIVPDVIFAAGDAPLRFVHRVLDDGDLYFVSNGAAHAQRIEASFRVTGQSPELWQADSGNITPLSYRIENGRTLVPLELDANEAVFVVFLEATQLRSRVVEQPTRQVLAVLDGPWEVRFPAERGAPARARFARLHSWIDDADAGIKYFSGTATYARRVKITRDWLLDGARIQLELGAVKNLAQVLVNGRRLGVLWNPPFTADITDALQAGDNDIDVEVTNLWPNRLIGDQQLDAHPVAFATNNPFKADSPLISSGLLGPVTLVRLRRCLPHWRRPCGNARGAGA